jgi:hypothetical protein
LCQPLQEGGGEESVERHEHVHREFTHVVIFLAGLPGRETSWLLAMDAGAAGYSTLS